MAHVYISAAHKSSGKTTLSIGLCAALREAGQQVQPFKKGPDYIDPLWLGEAAGRPCHNLDFYTMARDEIDDLFATGMRGADIGLIEGNKGLYDGLALDGSNSNAALAAQLGSPIVLVLDSQGMTRGVAPLILGYQAFEPAIRIVGVILNKVGGSRHEAKLRAVIGHYTDVAVIGAVHKNDALLINERHLGLVPSNELAGSLSHIERMGGLIRDQVDLGRLLELAGSAPPPAGNPGDTTATAADPVRIGYARDSAFGFYYAGDLEALRGAGATLVPFSPVHDADLPAVDGLFIGGGFPETHMQALEDNVSMRAAVAGFIARGGPVYAECGGLMYLCERLTWEGNARKMAGVIPVGVEMHAKPQGRGYVRLRETAGHPWPLSTDGSEPIPAHEFHYSALAGAIPDGFECAYRVERGFGIDGEYDGLRYRNLLASYAHLRDTRSHPWARRFVAFVRGCRDGRV